MKKYLFGLMLLLGAAANAGDSTNLNLFDPPTLAEVLKAMHEDKSRNDIARTKDGKFVVVGHRVNSDGKAHMGVHRYKADGTLDTAFGNCGIVEILPPNVDESKATSIKVLPDGKLIIEGFNGDEELIIRARLLDDGFLDASYHKDVAGIYDKDMPGITVGQNPEKVSKFGWIF